MEALLVLFNEKRDNQLLSVMFKGYLFLHSKDCNTEGCVLRKHQIAGEPVFIDDSIVKPTRRKDTDEKVQSILLEHLNQRFSICVRMDPRTVSVRLAYALFKIEYTRNHYSALNDLSDCKLLEPSFVEEFLIYHYESVINDFQRVKKHPHDATVSLSMEYKRNFDMLEKRLHRTALLHSQLWSFLIEGSPDYYKIKSTGFKILELLGKIEKVWDKLQSIVPNVSKTLKLYANFHLYVLNDKTEYEILVNRSNDYMVARNFPGRYKGLAAEEQCNFSGDGTPCLFISGSPESFGNIVACNLAICREFGYQKSELIGKSVGTIFPPIIAKYELQLLRSHGKRADQNFAYGLHKNGYIFPIFFRVIETPSLLNESNFIALVYLDKLSISSEHVHVLLDKSFRIVAVSSNAIGALELTAETVRCNTVRMEVLGRQLEEGLGNQREVVIPYTYPKSDENREIIIDKKKVKKAVRKKLSLSSRMVELSCKVTKIGTKEEVLGYDVRVKMPGERVKNLAEHSTVASPLEFLYDKKLNRYFQTLPSADLGDV